jgi:acetyl esterase/lipase
VLKGRRSVRDLDIAETGVRELTGEWIVGTDVWRRLKASRTRRSRSKAANNSSSDHASPSPGLRGDSPDNGYQVDIDLGRQEGSMVKGNEKERVIYYVHGGAYYVGNAATHRLITIGVSKACNARVFGTCLLLSKGYAN